jgi:hypothetical protein
MIKVKLRNSKYDLGSIYVLQFLEKTLDNNETVMGAIICESNGELEFYKLDELVVLDPNKQFKD